MFRLSLTSLSRSLAATAVTGALSLTFAWHPAAATTTQLGLQLPGDPAIGMLLSAEQALLVLTNADRAANGLAPLEFDPDGRIKKVDPLAGPPDGGDQATASAAAARYRARTKTDS